MSIGSDATTRSAFAAARATALAAANGGRQGVAAGARAAAARASATGATELVEVAQTRESALNEINALLAKARGLPVVEAAAASTAAAPSAATNANASTSRDAPFAVYAGTIERFLQTSASEGGGVFSNAPAAGVSTRHAIAAYAAQAADRAPELQPVAASAAKSSSSHVIDQALADVSEARATIDASLKRLSALS